MKKRNLTIISLLLTAALGSCGTAQNTPANSSETSTTPVISSAAETTAAETTTSVTTAAETTTTFAETAVSGNYTAEKPTEPITLTNRMTDFERAYITKRPFSLLDDELPAPDIKICNVIVTKEATIELYTKWLNAGDMTEEEFAEETAHAEDITYKAAIINGAFYSYYIPSDGYDGGRLVITNEISFDNKEAFFDEVEANVAADGYNAAGIKLLINQAKAVFDAVINGTYTTLPDYYMSYNVPFNTYDSFADYRSSWVFDREALAEIKDHIDEYVLYDEPLGLEFLVHVTLPPDYDASESYPVFLMTDGVWRLNDHAELYKAMENGEASDVILVSLAYNYNTPGTEDQFRDNLLLKEREGLLNFITDDLMPWLSECYSIDCTDSTLFGHSMGGVFSHYALFMSDNYENQPFFRYIIGSPALFNLYSENYDYAPTAAENDYSYFDRHDTLDKKVFLCGGSLEDPDYSGAYNGHDSLLTGLKKMTDRISAHDADYTYKLYESHHYQYVPGMLLEFLKTEYPAD